MGVWGEAKAFAGEFVDANAHVAGGLLDTVGLHDWAHTVDSWGDGIADDLGAAVGELNLGQTDDPKELVHGDVKALGETVKHLQNFAGAFDTAAMGLGRMDSAHWQGKAAEAFRAKFGEHPAAWQTTAEACTGAAKALDALSHTIEWAQDQAKQAIDLYQHAEQQTKNAHDQYQHRIDSYNHAVDTYNTAVKCGQSPTPPTKPGDFTDPGTEGRKQAAETLQQARKARDEAVHTAEAALRAATERAPKKAGLWTRLGRDLEDAPQIAAVGYVHVGGGLLKGADEMVKFGRGLSPYDPYNLTHPAQYADHVSHTAAGLVQARDHPVQLLSGLVGSGWGHDPSEAFGKLVFNIGSGALTGGGEDAAIAAERIAANGAEDAARNLASHTAEDAAAHAFPPRPFDPAVPHPADPFGTADPFNTSVQPAHTELDGWHPHLPDAEPAPAPAPEPAPGHVPDPEAPHIHQPEPEPEPHAADPEPPADEPARKPLRRFELKEQTPEEKAKAAKELQASLDEFHKTGRVFDDAGARSWAGRVWNDTALNRTTGAQKTALKYYSSGQQGATATSSGLINGGLRSGGAMDWNSRRAVELLDQALNLRKVPSDVIVTRGTDLGFLDVARPEDMVGRVFTEQGYMSTAFGDLPSSFANKEAVMHLRVPKDTPAMWMEKAGTFEASERELLLARGRQYRVLEVHQVGNQFHILADIL